MELVLQYDFHGLTFISNNKKFTQFITCDSLLFSITIGWFIILLIIEEKNQTRLILFENYSLIIRLPIYLLQKN